MKVIGLTGGIGSGKSTVSAYLQGEGYTVIDADNIARNMVMPGSGILKKLAEVFGCEIINDDGTLKRKTLAEKAFSDKNMKKKLDDIMMEEIIAQICDSIKYHTEKAEKLIFIDAPLLFESGLDSKTDETWVVDSEDEVRIARVMKRDNLTREEVLARINNQMSREEKNKRADFVLDNSKNTEYLFEQIRKLLRYE